MQAGTPAWPEASSCLLTTVYKQQGEAKTTQVSQRTACSCKIHHLCKNSTQPQLVSPEEVTGLEKSPILAHV